MTFLSSHINGRVSLHTPQSHSVSRSLLQQSDPVARSSSYNSVSLHSQTLQLSLTLCLSRSLPFITQPRVIPYHYCCTRMTAQLNFSHIRLMLAITSFCLLLIGHRGTDRESCDPLPHKLCAERVTHSFMHVLLAQTSLSTIFTSACCESSSSHIFWSPVPATM